MPVFPKDLLELEPPHNVEALHDKLHAKDFGKLGAVVVAAAGGLFLDVVEVGSHDEVTKDKSRDAGW